MCAPVAPMYLMMLYCRHKVIHSFILPFLSNFDIPGLHVIEYSAITLERKYQEDTSTINEGTLVIKQSRVWNNHTYGCVVS